MIQPLRNGHYRIFLGLAIILPVIIVAGLNARRNRPSSTQETPSLPFGGTHVSSASVLWKNNSLVTVAYMASTSSGAVNLLFKPSKELSDPDLLVYWAEHDIGTSSDLSQARLLGSLASGSSFSLPRQRSGFLILYSLAHQVVVDTARVEGLP